MEVRKEVFRRGRERHFGVLIFFFGCEKYCFFYYFFWREEEGGGGKGREEERVI